MCTPDGSMADDMNIIPGKYYKQLMQEAKDAAMADGELDDAEREALENPKERIKRMLAKTPAQISSEQRFQSEYSDIFHRKPPPGLFYVQQHDGIGNACGTIACLHAVANGVRLHSRATYLLSEHAVQQCNVICFMCIPVVPCNLQTPRSGSILPTLVRPATQSAVKDCSEIP